MSDEKNQAGQPAAAQPAAPAQESQTTPDAATAPEAKAPARKVHPNRVAYETLAELYPDLFNVKAPKPLKIGIHVDLAEDGKLSKTKIRRALNYYVQQLSYIRAVAGGGARFNLAGEAGEVTPEDAAHALARVKDIEAKRKAKRDERRAAELKNNEGKETPSRPRRPRKPGNKPADGKSGKPAKAADAKRKPVEKTPEAAEDQGLSKEERLNRKLASLAERFGQ